MIATSSVKHQPHLPKGTLPESLKELVSNTPNCDTLLEHGWSAAATKLLQKVGILCMCTMLRHCHQPVRDQIFTSLPSTGTTTIRRSFPYHWLSLLTRHH
jgi:hypothetical protein